MNHFKTSLREVRVMTASDYLYYSGYGAEVGICRRVRILYRGPCMNSKTNGIVWGSGPLKLIAPVKVFDCMPLICRTALYATPSIESILDKFCNKHKRFVTALF